MQDNKETNENNNLDLDLRSSALRFEKNPFIYGVDEETGEEKLTLEFGKTKRKIHNNDARYGVVKMQDDGNAEMMGTYAFVETKTVDEDAFVKFYVSELGRLEGLSKLAQKVFLHIIPDLKPNSDELYIDFRTVQIRCGYRTKQQLYKGIKELIAQEFIAPTMRLGWWFINPRIAFNGNRMFIGKVISKKPMSFSKFIETKEENGKGE